MEQQLRPGSWPCQKYHYNQGCLLAPSKHKMASMFSISIKLCVREGLRECSSVELSMTTWQGNASLGGNASFGMNAVSSELRMPDSCNHISSGTPPINFVIVVMCQVPRQ